MTKIAIIGAGGYEFPLQLMNDFLSFPSTQDAHYALMDIDPLALARTERLARRLVDAHRLPAKIDPTTDRAAALNGADFVVVCFQVGGRDAYAVDIKDQPMAAGAGAPPADATPPPTTLSDVKVDGSTFSFKRTIESPQGTIALDYSGSVDGDALTAKAHSDFGDVDITGTRAQ